MLLLVSVELSIGHFGHMHVFVGQVVVGGPGAIVVLLLSLSLSDVELFEDVEFESLDSSSAVFVSLLLVSDLFLLVKVS